MRLPIAHPSHIPGAIDAMRKSIDILPVAPESVHGFMLSVPARRILRAVHGSAYWAIWWWLWHEIARDLRMARMRVYLTKEEREGL